LQGTKVTDAGLQVLDHFRQLRVLDLSGTPVGDPGISRVVQLPVIALLSVSKDTIAQERASEFAGTYHAMIMDWNLPADVTQLRGMIETANSFKALLGRVDSDQNFKWVIDRK